MMTAGIAAALDAARATRDTRDFERCRSNVSIHGANGEVRRRRFQIFRR